MTTTKLYHPHDKLFKSSLAYPEVAQEFLSLYLPESMKKNLDSNSVEPCKTSFIDRQLHNSHTDVLFKARVSGREAYLYILAEHQSSVDKLMPFRLLEYMLCIWNFHIKQTKKKEVLPLPLIFPLVYFTGKGPYTGCRTLWELFGENAENMQQILQAPFHLIEVNRLPEKELIEHRWAGTLSFVMREQFKQDFREELKKIAATLNSIGLEKEGDYLIELVNYILDIADEQVDVHDLVTIMHDDLSLRVENKIMSLADRLRQEGRQEGELKKSLEIAQRLLEESSNLAFIAKITKLPLARIKALQKNRN